MDVEGGQPVRREGEDTPLVVNTNNVEARSSKCLYLHVYMYLDVDVYRYRYRQIATDASIMI